MKITKFKITYRSSELCKPIETGIQAKSAEDVYLFAEIIGKDLDVRYTTSQGEYCRLDIELEENSGTLNKVYDKIEELYGYKPCELLIRPPDQYEKYFGVQRYISFVESELDMAEYLCVNSTKLIGEGVYRRPPNEVEKEIYSLSRKRRNKRLIGYISEYNTLAVDQKFKDLLMLESILGIDLNKKVLKDDKLWLLWSSVLMPPCLTELIKNNGLTCTEDQEWEEFEVRNFETRYDAPLLKYSRRDMESIEPFDIALTKERVYGDYYSAYRLVIVSQSFRQLMKKLKIKDLDYTPVELVD